MILLSAVVDDAASKVEQPALVALLTTGLIRPVTYPMLDMALRVWW